MTATEQYHDLLGHILSYGVWRNDPNREDTQRLQIPFCTLVFNMEDGFPLLTTKKMWWKGIVLETLWCLRGESNTKALTDNGVHIWDKDAPDGNIGRMYGVQWRDWGYRKESNGISPHVGWNDSIDQLKNVIHSLLSSPLSSNHTIFGDNPVDRDNQALPCCMNYMQFSCEPASGRAYYLDLSINYRSWDVLLGEFAPN